MSGEDWWDCASQFMMTKQNWRPPHLPTLLFINYLVVSLLISLRDATIPETMAKLAATCAPNGLEPGGEQDEVLCGSANAGPRLASSHLAGARNSHVSGAS